MSAQQIIQCFTCRPLWRWLSFLVLASLSLAWPVVAEDAGRDDKQDAAEPTVARGAREMEAALTRARVVDGPYDVAASFEAEMALWMRFRDDLARSLASWQVPDLDSPAGRAKLVEITTSLNEEHIKWLDAVGQAKDNNPVF